MLILAHRGYRATSAIPENSMEAFSFAVQRGADGIELDVQSSADGIPVVFHDRVIHGQPIVSLTHSQLSKLAGFQVPTLEESIACSTDVLWNIEIKSPCSASKVVDVVQRHQRSHRFLVTSFWHDVIADVSTKIGDVDCGVIAAHRPIASENPLIDAWPAPANVNTVVWKYDVLDPILIAAATAAGIRTVVFGALIPEENERCRELGVHALITDDVELAAQR